MKTQPATLLPKIAQVLRQRAGRENAITSFEIALAVNRNQRAVRAAISENLEWFWDQDIAVLAAPGGGFFVGDDLEQFVKYREVLTALGFQIDEKIKAFDKLCAKRGLCLKAPKITKS